MKSISIREMTTEEIQRKVADEKRSVRKVENATCDFSIREPIGSQGKAQKTLRD